ncbi:hypothetical protein [Streptomyces pulveraceus]|uniref:Uncharacterized protein n=1 Tax=Streptomyces pulveraceus TaxID=68258 RepID=A0ABW1GIR2_9ACTN
MVARPQRSRENWPMMTDPVVPPLEGKAVLNLVGKPGGAPYVQSAVPVR